MRYVSHLACSVCGSTFPADAVMNLCPQDGRPVQVVLDLDRLKAERGRDGGWDPPGATSGGSAGSCRSMSPTRTIAGTSSRWARDARRASRTPIRWPIGRLPARGQGRGEAAPRLRREPDPLVQGPGDGDDGLDGPGPGPDAAGRADPGERRRRAGRVRRRRRASRRRS